MKRNRLPFCLFACLLITAFCAAALCTSVFPQGDGGEAATVTEVPGETLQSGEAAVTAQWTRAPADPKPPSHPVKLVFVHHSCGENWLLDDNGGLGLALRDNNYFVSDTNYGWGPEADGGWGPVGDSTDTGHWYLWFQGPNSAAITEALYAESGQNSAYSRLGTDPGGKNRIIMFKSCFPNSALRGSAGDPVPAIVSNPLKAEGSDSEYQTVANAKGIYIDLLEYFKAHQDTLFVAVTAPPISDGTYAANARSFNNWLVNDWLTGYPYNNVMVFDFYNVLTSNGGSAEVNDYGKSTGNHHRWQDGQVQHIVGTNKNTAAYAQAWDDDHPTAAGNQKASAEFIPLLNYAYNRWSGA